MRKRPLVGMFLMTILGNIVPKTTYSIWALSLSILVMTLLLFRRRKDCMILIFLFCSLVGTVVGYHTRESYEQLLQSSLARIQKAKEQNLELRVEGIVKEIQWTQKNCVIHFTSCHLLMSDVSWSIPDLLIQTNNNCIVKQGDFLLVEGEFELPKKKRNDGGYNQYQDYWAKGLLGSFSAKKLISISRFSGQSGFENFIMKMRQFIYAKNGAFRNSMNQFYLQKSNDESGIIAAMCLGMKKELKTEVRSQFTEAGIAHVLAISGVHISIVGMTLFSFVRKFGASLWSASILAVMVTFGFVEMTGGGISGLRAFLMFVISLGAMWCGRMYDGINAIALSGSILLWIFPYYILAPAFQYSYVSIAAVFVGKRLIKRSYRRLHPLLSSCFMGMVLSLSLLPVTAWYSGRIPTLSFLINLVAVPLVTPILLMGLVSGLLGGPLSQGVVGLIGIDMGLSDIATLFLKLGEKGVTLLKILAQKYEVLPFGNIVCGHITLSTLVFYYVTLCLCMALVWQKRKLHYLCCILPALVFLLNSNAGYTAKITFLDVGQGDGIYLETKDGKTMMIDGGSSSQGMVGNYIIEPYLTYHGRKQIDYWWVSHLDEDHISGLVELLEQGYPIKHLIVSVNVERNKTFQNICQLAKRQGTEMIFALNGMVLRGLGYQIEVFGCEEEKEHENQNVYDDKVELTGNDASMVLLLTEKKRGQKYLFAGDIGQKREEEILKQLKRRLHGGIYLLKANHHGSKYSNSEEWLEKLSPKVIVVSYGEKNRYGHPHKEAIERMKKTGANIYCTGKGGQITVGY